MSRRAPLPANIRPIEGDERAGVVQETGGERRDKGVGKQDIHSNVPLLLLFAAANAADADAADDADK